MPDVRLAPLYVPAPGDRDGAGTKPRAGWRWSTKLMLVLGVLLALVLLAFWAWVHQVRGDNPRDEAAFLETVSADYRAPMQQKLVGTDAILLAEGDAACGWLDDQPRAFWRTDDKYRYDALLDRYLATDATDLPAWFSMPADNSVRRQITMAAWGHLCGASWRFHQPHPVPNPFSSVGD